MRRSSQRKLFAGLCLLLCWQAGCAAFRPVHGVPARYLPGEMKVGDRSNRRTIDLSLLRQSPPIDPVTGNVVHRIDGGDVLGVYVEGFVGKSTDPPPVFFPTNNDTPPSFGLPFPVRDDGTISLPAVGSVNLRGMTLVEAEERVKQAYLEPRQLIRPDFHRVQVNLQRPRQYRVLVIRQDSRTEPSANGFLGQVNIGVVKRGTGKVVNLPAYSNDVLNALTATDGLPGLDAQNAVIVIRGHSNSQGGSLDPRWPVDLDPSLMLRSGAVPEGPVIRGQSGDDQGYLHSENLNFHRSENVPPVRPPVTPQRSQPTGTMGPGSGSGRNSAPNSAGFGYGVNAPLEPPRIWPDRSNLSTIAFDSPDGPSTGASPPFNPVPVPNQMMSQPKPPNVGGVGSMTATGYKQQSGPSGHPSRWDWPQSNGMPPSPPPGSQFPNPATNPPTSIGQNSGPGLGLVPELEAGLGVAPGTLRGRHVVRIPIRLGPGETADIRPEDVVLNDGDIVFIESRDTEVFYTGGLLGGGQYTLPRDYDLDILQAISLAQSRATSSVGRSIGGTSALNGDVAISPSIAIVLRKLPDGGEIPVKVDLYRARTDLSERIFIQPGDFILLQYTPLEAVAAFIERHLLETALFSLAAQNLNKTGL